MRFLKSNVQILAFGEIDDSIIFGADNQLLLEALRQIEQQLRKYNGVIENTIRVSAELTKQGIRVRANLDQITESGTRLNTTIGGLITSQTTLKESLNVVSQTLSVTRGAEEKLREERERAKRVSIELAEADIKRANAARLAARATGRQIARELPRGGAQRFGASVDEARALGNAIGRLQEIQQRFNISQQQVIRIFNTVKTRGIAAYAGINRQVANASLSVIKANAAIGQTNQRLAAVSTVAKQAGKDNVEAARRSEIGWRSFGRLIFVNVVSRAFGALLNVIREGITLAAEFTIKIGEIRTIQGDNVRTTGQWVGELRKLSEEFAGITIIDAAEAAYQTLSNQIAKGAEVTEFLADAQRFAVASVSSLTDSTNLLSSAINAFGLEARNARQISDSFFKTIELGRIRANDIANSFGRVGVLANQLGVTLDEVNASIATLSIQGISADETLTALRNVMLKLIRPTDEMKKKFAEFGVTSGEALIRTFGFSGAIQKFADIATREGTPAIGKLFGRVRAIVGVLGLARDNGSKFAETLDKISNAAGATDEAFKKVSETIGFRFKKEIEIIRNFVTIDLGEKLLATLLKVGDLFGGLAVAVKSLALAVTAAVSAFILFKIAVLAITPVGLVITGIALAVGALGLAFFNAEKEVDNSINKIKESLEKLREEQVRADDKVTKQLRKSLDDRAKLLLQDIAERRATINKRVNIELDALKIVDEELKRTFREATKALKDSIRESEQEAKRATQEIERSVKRVREAIQQDLVDQFSRSLENLIPADKIAALDDRITTLISNAGSLFNQIGSDAGVTFDDVLSRLDEAADRIQEIDSIRKDAENNIGTLVDKRSSILRKNEDAEIRFLRRRSDLEAQFLKARGDPEKQAKIIERIRRLEEDATRAISRRREDFAEAETQLTAQRDLVAQILDLGRQEAELLKTRIGLEKERQALLKKQADDAKAEAIIQRENLRQFEIAFKRVLKFEPIKILTKQDSIFAETAINVFAARALDRLKTIDDIAVRLRAIEAIETKRARALAAIRGQEANRLAGIESKNLENQTKLQSKAIDEAIKKREELAKVIKTQSDKALEDFRLVLKLIKDIPFDSVIKELEGPFKKALQGNAEDFQIFLDKLEEFRKELRDPSGDVLLPETSLQRLIDVARALATLQKARAEVQRIRAQEVIDEKALAEALEKQVRARERLNFRAAGATIIPGFQHGGLVPGSTDTIPAMLSPGEFVVNAEATRKFFTQLQAINSGRIQRFQEGGIVNNVGDINVSIQSAPSNVDGREIARAIKKELFRGSVKFR